MVSGKKGKKRTRADGPPAKKPAVVAAVVAAAAPGARMASTAAHSSGNGTAAAAGLSKQLAVVQFDDARTRRALVSVPKAVQEVNERVLRNTLDSLLHPMDPQTFLEDCYKKKATAILGGGESRIAWLRSQLSDLDIDSLVERSPSPQINVWMRRISDQRNTSIQTTPEQAAEAYRCGASLYFRAPGEVEEAFLPMIGAALGMNFSLFDTDGVRAEIETFCHRAGHKTNVHYDYMENITVQLSGKKKWSFRSSGVRHPHRSCATHFEEKGSALLARQTAIARCQNPDFEPVMDKGKVEGEFESVVLCAGDVLYHPAGVWHDVETVEDSVSVNMSFMNATWGELFQDVVGSLTMSHPCLSERITIAPPGPSTTHASTIENAHAQVSQRLAVLTGALSSLLPQDVLPSIMVYPGGAVKCPPALLQRLSLTRSGGAAAVVPPDADTSFLARPAGPVTVLRNPLGLLVQNTAGDSGTWTLPDLLKDLSGKAKNAAILAEWDDDRESLESDEEGSGCESEGDDGGLPAAGCRKSGCADKACCPKKAAPELLEYSAMVHLTAEGDAVVKIIFGVPAGEPDVKQLLDRLVRLPPQTPLVLPEVSPLCRATVSLLIHVGFLRLEPDSSRPQVQ
ncbi:hypothetical protein DIPPA_29968 [Diplonema papillatum]|nr:hypothetical protein DIPPA_29968 [Diplonema papillatum]|eukprot:gene2425-3763_t